MLLKARKALGLYGEFARNLIMPYICVDLNLDEQLIYLSAAAHLAFYFYTNDGAKTTFMPSQSYVDIDKKRLLLRCQKQNRQSTRETLLDPARYRQT